MTSPSIPHKARAPRFLGSGRFSFEDRSVPAPGSGQLLLRVRANTICGTCRSCTLGSTNQCLAKRADMGFTHDGGYGPYELVHESNFFPTRGSR